MPNSPSAPVSAPKDMVLRQRSACPPPYSAQQLCQQRNSTPPLSAPRRSSRACPCSPYGSLSQNDSGSKPGSGSSNPSGSGSSGARVGWGVPGGGGVCPDGTWRFESEAGYAVGSGVTAGVFSAAGTPQAARTSARERSAGIIRFISFLPSDRQTHSLTKTLLTGLPFRQSSGA